MSDKKLTLSISDVELSNGGDAGNTITFRCPECKTRIPCADAGWWDTKCRCGYAWSVTVLATGTPTQPITQTDKERK